MYKDAKFSKCRTYRYALWRIWDDSVHYAMFICLNPSTADEFEDDPTLIRCMHYAERWGYGGVCLANLFAYRATDPRALREVSDPIGPQNSQWLLKLSKGAGVVIAAWGNGGEFRRRAEDVCNFMSAMSCLKINKTGQPAHPLYLKKAVKPVPYVIQN